MSPGLLINIDVDDLERAVRFYTRALGLTVGGASGRTRWSCWAARAPLPAGEGRGDARLALLGGGARLPAALTPVHLDFVVEDVAAARRGPRRRGEAEGDIIETGWGRMALMADPFGHGFCLLQFRGRGYDEIATGRAEARTCRRGCSGAGAGRPSALPGWPPHRGPAGAPPPALELSG